MQHIVQFSTGIASWAVAQLLLDQHGPDHITLLFADTNAEDTDNYRFLRDAQAQLGLPVVRVADGRTIGSTPHRFWHYHAHGVRLVAAARWDPAAHAWIPEHRFHSYATPAPLHARCERRQCEDCDDIFDECEARYRDEWDEVLCGDCHAGRAVQAEDEAAWRSYAY